MRWTLTFTRGTNDTITITSPSQSPPEITAATPATGLNAQGCFFLRASHEIGTESPVEVEGEILLRNLGIIITDTVAVYP